MKSSISYNYKSWFSITIALFLLVSTFGAAMGQSRDSLISAELQRQLKGNKPYLLTKAIQTFVDQSARRRRRSMAGHVIN
jgi:hypothetical protein